jgi:hypothetical protein
VTHRPFSASSVARLLGIVPWPVPVPVPVPVLVWDSSQVSEQSRGLRQKACRDGGLVAYVTRHGAWARMALLAPGATRAGTTATHGHEHDGCRRSSRARRLMNGNLPDALDGARWRFERARCGWQRSRGRTAEQQVCCAARRFLRIIVGGALLDCCYAWGWAQGRSP